MKFLANPVCGIARIPSPWGSWVGVVTGRRCVDLEGTEKAQPFCALRVEQGRQMRGGSGTCWLRHMLRHTLGRVWATLGCGAPACPAGSCIMEITGGESSSRLSLILPTPHPSFLPSWLSGDQHSRLKTSRTSLLPAHLLPSDLPPPPKSLPKHLQVTLQHSSKTRSFQIKSKRSALMLRPFIICPHPTVPSSPPLLPNMCILPSKASRFFPVGIYHAHAISQICPQTVGSLLLQGPVQVLSSSQNLHQGHQVQYLREKILESGCMNSDPGFALPALNDLEQITSSFCASVSPTVKR